MTFQESVAETYGSAMGLLVTWNEWWLGVLGALAAAVMHRCLKMHGDKGIFGRWRQ